MATYEIKTNKGTYQIETAENSSAQKTDTATLPMLGSSENQDQSQTPPASATQQSSPENTPEQNAAAIEQTIAGRQSMFGKNAAPADFSSFGKGAGTVLRGLATPFQIAEAIPADIGLAAQRAQTGGFEALPGNLAKDISGERAPQIGDIYRASGVPGLSSEPVAATLGLVAASAGHIPNLWAKGATPLAIEAAKMGIPEAQQAVKLANEARIGIPNPAALGTNLVGEAYAKALSPAAELIKVGIEKIGKPAVATVLEMTTNRHQGVWKDLIDNPEWGSKKYVDMLNKEAGAAYEKNVIPLAENTKNRVPIGDDLKNKLIDMGIFIKPEGVDNSTFMKALTGDRVSVQALEQRLLMDKMAALNLDSGMSAAERGRAINKIYNNRVNLSPLEPSQGLGGMTGNQKTQITTWFKKLLGSEDMSYNQMLTMQKEMNAAQESYYKLSKAEGTGITGAQAKSFNHYVGQMQGLVNENLSKLPQYKDSAKAIKLYAKARQAQRTLHDVSGIDPHMFRAIFTRMGLTAVGLPSGVAGGLAAAGSVPAVNKTAIQGLAKLSGVISKNPASILSPLLRGVGNASQ